MLEVLLISLRFCAPSEVMCSYQLSTLQPYVYYNIFSNIISLNKLFDQIVMQGLLLFITFQQLGMLMHYLCSVFARQS